MKVAISSSGRTLESNVDSRFGRCPYFLIYDTDSGDIKAIENQSRQAMGGAGIQAAQMVSDKKVDAVVTGNIGPNAFKVLSAASINVFSGVTGTVEKAIEKIKSGQLKTTSAPDAPSHFGTGPKWNE